MPIRLRSGLTGLGVVRPEEATSDLQLPLGQAASVLVFPTLEVLLNRLDQAINLCLRVRLFSRQLDHQLRRFELDLGAADFPRDCVGTAIAVRMIFARKPVDHINHVSRAYSRIVICFAAAKPPALS
jgi:hypothetical protein